MIEILGPLGLTFLSSAAFALNVLSISVNRVYRKNYEDSIKEDSVHGQLAVFGDVFQLTADKGKEPKAIKKMKEFLKVIEEDFRLHTKHGDRPLLSRDKMTTESLTSFSEVAQRSASLTAKIVIVVVAIVQAVIPLVFMRIEHPSTYALGRDPLFTAAILGYAFSAFCGTSTLLTVVVLGLDHFEDMRELIVCALYIASTVHRRNFLSRFYKPQLKRIQVRRLQRMGSGIRKTDSGLDKTEEWLPLLEADTERKALDELDVNDWTMADENKRLLTSFNDAEKKLRKVRLSKESKDLSDVQEHFPELHEFETLSIELFMLVRKWLKSRTFAEVIQLREIAVTASVLVIVLMIVGILNVFTYKALGASSIVVLWNILILAPVVLSILNAMVTLNKLLVDDTTSVILAWKDMVQRTQWISQSTSHQPISEFRVRLDNYFRSLLTPCEHLIEQIERSEAPISFFSLPMTPHLRDRILLSAAT
jgi:hypothetical protein